MQVQVSKAFTSGRNEFSVSDDLVALVFGVQKGLGQKADDKRTRANSTNFCKENIIFKKLKI